MEIQITPLALQTPAVNTPAGTYLASLSPNSASTMAYALQSIAKIVLSSGIHDDEPDAVDIYDFPWQEINYQAILLIKQSLAARYHIRTSNLYLTGLRGVLKACWRLELISHEELSRRMDFQMVEGEEEAEGRALSTSEIGDMLEVCRSDRNAAKGARDEAIILLGVGGGFRRSELVSLLLKDLEYTSRGGNALVRRGKGAKDRRVPLPAKTVRAVDQWLDYRGVPEESRVKIGPVIVRTNTLPRLNAVTTQTIYDILKRRSEQANLPPVAPHDLRRTFVTSLLESGVDPFLVQTLAGHASVDTTSAYDKRTIHQAIDNALASFDRSFRDF